MSVIVIPDEYNVGTEENDYISSHSSLASENEFIPIYSLINGERLTAGEKVEFLYNLRFNYQVNHARRFSDFCNQIGSRHHNGFYRITHSTITKQYYSSPGSIIHIDEEHNIIPLLAMCVRKSQLFNVNRANPDPKQFCLLIDRKFETDENHFKLFRNVKKNYIVGMEDKVDILFSNDITNLCFHSTKDRRPVFRTVAEMLLANDINSIVEAEIHETSV